MAPPKTGPVKSPILTPKLYIAEEISFAVNSSKVESFSFNIRPSSIRQGTLIVAPEAPNKANPKMIESKH